MKRSEEFFDKLTDKEKDFVLKSIMVLKQIKSISELQEIIDATETIDGKNFIRFLVVFCIFNQYLQNTSQKSPE